MAKEHGLSESEPRVSPIETEDPDALTTATVGIVGTLIVIIVVVFLQGLYEKQKREEFQRKVVDEVPIELRNLRAAQLAQLQATGWIDKEKGIVAIPIERAMALLAADPNPAAPIVVAPPPSTPSAPSAPDAKKAAR
jgi:hypothetical protein